MSCKLKMKNQVHVVPIQILWKRNCMLNAQCLDVENEKHNVTIVKLNVELYNVA